MSKKMRDIILFVVLILFGTAATIYAYRYQNSSSFVNDLSSAFLPQISSGLIIIFALLGLINAVRNKNEEYCKKVPFEFEDKKDLLRGLASIVLMLFYVLTFNGLGFIVSSIIYLFTQLMLLTTKGNRHWIRNAMIGIGLPIVCYCFFVFGLNYILPTGILG